MDRTVAVRIKDAKHIIGCDRAFRVEGRPLALTGESD
jgi:hypothetical protein